MFISHSSFCFKKIFKKLSPEEGSPDGMTLDKNKNLVDNIGNDNCVFLELIKNNNKSFIAIRNYANNEWFNFESQAADTKIKLITILRLT